MLFQLSVPYYMGTTYGMIDNAVVQYNFEETNLYSFVIKDRKAELKAMEIELNNAQEFDNYLIKFFIRSDR